MCDCFSFICDITFNRLSTLLWRWCNRALLRLVRREAEVKATCLCFKSVQPCYSRFARRFPKYIPLKILSTNESRLFPGSRHSGDKKKIKQSVVKWDEPNCTFQIINFYLSYPLLLFFLFIIHFCISLSYYFLPPTFSGTHLRTVITGSYAPTQVTTGKPSLPNTWKRWKNKLLTWVGQKSSLFWQTNSLEKHISVVLWVSKTSYRKWAGDWRLLVYLGPV